MKEYVLRTGDTLESLSARYGVPACMIARANRMGEGAAPASLLIPDAYYCMREQAKTRDAGALRCREYTVRDGETLYHIAQRFGITLSILARVNAIRDPSLLRAGESLKIPALPASCGRYSIRPGETLQDVSQRYRVPEERIRACNCLRPDEDVFPGMQLLIPRT